MTSGFYDTFGQIGATVVSILFTLFVGYLLYIKERRDKISDEMTKLHDSMISIFNQIVYSRFTADLLSDLDVEVDWNEKVNSLAYWTAGVPWEMLLEVKNLHVRDIWDGVFEGFHKFTKGLLSGIQRVEDPNVLFKWEAGFAELVANRTLLSEWEQTYVENTKHVEFFCHQYGSWSWANSLVEKIAEFILEGHVPSLEPEEVRSLFDGLKTMRDLALKDLHLEKTYQNLKNENAISHYKIIFAGFLIMGISSIVAPPLMLLLPPFKGEYLIPPITLSCFILSSLLTLGLLIKSTHV